MLYHSPLDCRMAYQILQTVGLYLAAYQPRKTIPRAKERCLW